MKLNNDATNLVTDIGESAFNAAFAKCPVVRSLRAVYVRISPVPAGFNAYNVFTKTFSNANNKINEDFKVYATIEDAKSKSNAWNFCNYNHNGAGFPVDCGPASAVYGHRFFTRPGSQYATDVGRATSNNGLEIYVAEDCPSLAVEGYCLNGAPFGIHCCPHFTRGDAAGGTETHIGNYNQNDCITECKKRHGAVGATVKNPASETATGQCWCEFGDKTLDTGRSSDLKTCFFPDDGCEKCDYGKCDRNGAGNCNYYSYDNGFHCKLPSRNCKPGKNCWDYYSHYFYTENSYQPCPSGKHGELKLYSGYNGGGRLVCTLYWTYKTPGARTSYVWNFERRGTPCADEEARSLVVKKAQSGTVIKLFDDEDGVTNNDYAVVTIKQDITAANPVTVYQVQRDFSNDYLNFNYVGASSIWKRNDLNGEVSRLEIHL